MGRTVRSTSSEAESSSIVDFATFETEISSAPEAGNRARAPGLGAIVTLVVFIAVLAMVFVLIRLYPCRTTRGPGVAMYAVRRPSGTL